MKKQGIPANEIKIGDILFFFETKNRQFFIIITSITNNMLFHLSISKDFGKMTIKDEYISFHKWNDKEYLGQKFKYCTVEDFKRCIKLVFEYEKEEE